MIDTTFKIHVCTDSEEEGQEILNDIKRLLKDSYWKYEIGDIKQEED